MKLYYYKETEICHYWQKLGVKDNHICCICNRKLRPNDRVAVDDYMDMEDGGAVCVSCCKEIGLI